MNSKVVCSMTLESNPFKLVLKMDTDGEQEIKLSLDNGSVFRLTKSVARQSAVIESLILDMCCDDEIVIPIIGTDRKTLEYAISYMKEKAKNPDEPLPVDPRQLKRSDNIGPWDVMFMSQLLYPDICNLMKLADYLDIGGLLRLTAKTIANMIKGKTPSQIREMFNIENDYTPEMEARVKAEFHYKDNEY